MYDLIDTQADFLVVAKHAGAHVHEHDGKPGLVTRVRASQGEELWLIHRLDAPTSGLMLLARSRDAASEFGKKFTQRQIDKHYLALSDRKPRKKQGAVRGGMVKARRGAWKLTRDTQNEALTHFVSTSVVPGLRAFSLRPRSGRTHQLRVALKSLGAPILGDTLYAGSPADRCYLHAAGLAFEYQGRRYNFWNAPTRGQHFTSDSAMAVWDRWSHDEARSR